MRTHVLFLSAFIGAPGAFADEVEIPAQIFLVHGIESNVGCAQKQIRQPNLVCRPVLARVPEAITLEIKTSDNGRRFVAQSGCRTLKGEVKISDLGTPRFKVKSDRDRCGGKKISLHHDAVFLRLPEVHDLKTDETGVVRALAFADTALVLTPVTQAPAER